MIDQAVPPAGSDAAPDVLAMLRGALSRGAGAGAATATLAVLRHLVAAADGPVLSEAVLAHVRAMVVDLAHGLAALPSGTGPALAADAIAHALLEDALVLSHMHTLALEWQLAERLETHLALDTVSSPLLEAWLNGPEHEEARTLLAAQARWAQARRRMELTAGELPSDVRAAALRCAQRPDAAGSHAPSRTDAAVRALRMPRAAAAMALDLTQAGLALFVTALALGCGCPRDSVVMWLHEPQPLRLALGLRAAGLSTLAAEAQVLVVHPAARLPEEWRALQPHDAAELLGARD